MTAPQALKLDHLVVAAQTLEAGEAHVIEQLGLTEVVPQRGGKHARMGTHNSLLGLWGGAYLEIIAIDPEAPPPDRPRWFGLDDEAVQARLERGPYLAHWVARVERPRSLPRWQAQYPQRLAPVMAMQRGALSWRIGVPDDGSLPAWQGAGQGLLPTLIQWDSAQHPSDALPSADCAVTALRGFHPQAAAIQAQLQWLGADALVNVEATLVEPSLTAEIETPDGPRTLR
ncbi:MULTISPECIES: VOC family protein [unclassified Pandoraea]|uniref:VOC family protein n=1 Tax=unclassified Pandoraea TaxID=2624094 RepID=UPI00034DB240|nr:MULTISPECIES: VOC family protein [unclassified Pandoraea]OJY20225.1 MAG: glyoxalase [Pandoraea sp. 64-18]